MPASVKTGAPVLGVIFLALAVFKFLNGDGWVVWAILGFLFGGLRLFASNRSGGAQS